VAAQRELIGGKEIFLLAVKFEGILEYF